MGSKKTGTRLLALLLALLLMTVAGCGRSGEDGETPEPAEIAEDAPEPVEPSGLETDLTPDELYDAVLREGLEALKDRNWLNLTHEEMLEDFDHFYESLVNNYPYFGVVERVKGLDMHQAYLEVRERIPACASDMEYYLLIYDYIEATGNAGHLVTSTPMLETEDMSEEARELYKEIERAYDDAYGFYQMAAGFEEDADNLTTEILEEGKVAYVHIRSFNNAYLEEGQERMFAFYDEIEGYDHLIIDISDNGGGAMSYYWDLLVSPNITETMFSIDYGFLKGGQINRDYLESRGLTFEEDYLPIGESFLDRPDWLYNEFNQYFSDAETEEIVRILLEQTFPPEELNLTDLEEFDYYSPSAFTIDPESDQKRFDGHIWVLVSDTVYSSSESFAILCKRTGFATLVGTQTGGDGIGMDPAIFTLPHSGFRVRYAPVYGTTLDGRSSEEFGTTPDIVSPEGETPLETCLRAIEEQ